MKTLLAFLKKEILEQIRFGRILIIGALFLLLGIMNPLIAKITPWLLEMFSDSLEGSGIIVKEVNITAMDSWVQFFKNIPIGLIAFVLLQSSIFTKEYSSGTLVLSLTKGLERFKVVIAKAIVLITLWTIGYWMCYAITYFYNSYFWDNSIAQNLFVSVLYWWVFGVFVISLITFFSTLSKTNTSVLLGIGGVVLLSYIISLIPKLSKYLPTFLMDGTSLIYGLKDGKDYIFSLFITIILSLICIMVSIPIFNKKQL